MCLRVCVCVRVDVYGVWCLCGVYVFKQSFRNWNNWIWYRNPVKVNFITKQLSNQFVFVCVSVFAGNKLFDYLPLVYKVTPDRRQLAESRYFEEFRQVRHDDTVSASRSLLN